MRTFEEVLFIVEEATQGFHDAREARLGYSSKDLSNAIARAVWAEMNSATKLYGKRGQ